MDTQSILEKTINLIEDNLDNQDLNISYLSDNVFVSPYHLQRIFYTLFGKTIGSYIRERRLTEAGTDINQLLGVHFRVFVSLTTLQQVTRLIQKCLKRLFMVLSKIPNTILCT